MCWPLYAGVLSALGLGFIDYTPYLFPVTVLLIVVSLVPLAWKAKQRHGYRPLVLGVIASILILWGRFYLDIDGIFYTGVALFLIASIWNIWPKHKKCTSCISSEK